MNVSHIFKQHAAENPDTTAILFEALRITYGELDRLVNRVAGGLLKLGLKRGEVPRAASGKALRRLLWDKEWGKCD